MLTKIGKLQYSIGTNSAHKSAVKLYYYNGFKQIEKNHLPKNFSIIKLKNYFTYMNEK